MALYVIGDTHFSETTGKPMDVFGGAWRDYREKLLRGLADALRTEDDVLVICGDLSWGMTLDEALEDFRLLTRFPGKKILLKGNHDYWWETMSKMQKFFDQNNITDLQFLHNNCIFYKETGLCGTRGWFAESKSAAENEKIYKREVLRLEASLAAARAARPDAELFAFLHYPPFLPDGKASCFCETLERFGVSRCYYGHLHGESIRSAFNGERGGVSYRLISADALSFTPLWIS